MSLTDPPKLWMQANGYTGDLGDERRRRARAHFAYEQEHGPVDEFEPGTRAYEQWTYTGGDPREVAA